MLFLGKMITLISRFSLLPASGTRKLAFENESVIVTVGEASYVSDASVEYGRSQCNVLIGRYCAIAHRVIFEVGLNHAYNYASIYPFDVLQKESNDYWKESNKNQIIIGNDVWIGCDVIIMGGVHIGNGAVIGAGAVVAKDVPPYSVVVGNPARVIKYRFEPDIIHRLQEIKWWYWPADEIKAKCSLMKNVASFLASCKAYPANEHVDDTVQALQILKKDGYHIYHIVVDYEESKPIWSGVLIKYLEVFSADNKVLLVLGIPRAGNDVLMKEMVKIVELHGENTPMVVPYQCSKEVNIALLRLVDTYITTKDESSSVIVDYLSGMDADIVYGLDYDGKIFI